MNNQVVNVPGVQNPVKLSPGFKKKALSDYKLDIMGLCGYGCTYCSSNWGNYLRINREHFAAITEEQLGQKSYPTDNPNLTFQFPDFIPKLDAQLSGVDKSFGKNQVLVFSQLTDGFSPITVGSGLTRYVLDTVLEKTSFTIRVMTKNATVGSDKWIRYFLKHRDRFIIGMSIGTTEDDWQEQVEIGTSTPTARIKAYNSLIDAGVRTYGMICPVFPHALNNRIIEDLLERLRVSEVEHIWAEPYNDRANWKVVQENLDDDHPDKDWLYQCYGKKQYHMWSDYASELYERLLSKAKTDQWDDKFTYLLYEEHILNQDVSRFGDLHGVMFQCSKDEHGYSKHPEFRNLQIDLESRGYRHAG